MAKRDHLHLGVLTGRRAYPNGMATAQRIRLISRALAEAGASVNVLVDGFDHWDKLQNPDAQGFCDGVPFRYVLGKTQASSSRIVRVVDRLRSILAVWRELSEAARRNSLHGLYFYTSVYRPEAERFIIGVVARHLRIPLVIDLCEAPWTFWPQPSRFVKKISPLWGAQGVIAISDFLEQWTLEEAQRIRRHVKVIKVPILTDVNEFRGDVFSEKQTVMFAGSPEHIKTILFVAKAMESVWAAHPDCTLCLTGITSGMPAHGALMSTLAGLKYKGTVNLAGYLSREQLISAYEKASILVIPLFDDVFSKARFPTKLGEYLAAGRPVVTNAVGEIPGFLHHGTDAMLVPPGDTFVFGKAISTLLDNRDAAMTMGQRGREVACRNFHYDRHGFRLVEFFKDLYQDRDQLYST